MGKHDLPFLSLELRIPEILLLQKRNCLSTQVSFPSFETSISFQKKKNTDKKIIASLITYTFLLTLMN